jgi:hypothetical protein
MENVTGTQQHSCTTRPSTRFWRSLLAIVYGCLFAVLCMSHLGIEACMGSVVRRVHVSGCGHTSHEDGIKATGQVTKTGLLSTTSWCKSGAT